MKFSKKDRLVSRLDFAAVFDAAHAPSGEMKTILHTEPYIIYRKAGKIPRLGLSVSRRVIKNANERNRIKRCIREFFRLHKEQLDGDYVIRVVNRPTDDDFKILTTPLQRLLTHRRGRTHDAAC